MRRRRLAYRRLASRKERTTHFVQVPLYFVRSVVLTKYRRTCKKCVVLSFLHPNLLCISLLLTYILPQESYIFFLYTSSPCMQQPFFLGKAADFILFPLDYVAYCLNIYIIKFTIWGQQLPGFLALFFFLTLCLLLSTVRL